MRVITSDPALLRADIHRANAALKLLIARSPARPESVSGDVELGEARTSQIDNRNESRSLLQLVLPEPLSRRFCHRALHVCVPLARTCASP
jgi:hypothetical protein